MQNYKIPAKKKFSTLTKLMKNQNSSSIPPLIKDSNIINDSTTKSELYNDIFVAKASVSGSDNPAPFLPPNEKVSSSLSSINT